MYLRYTTVRRGGTIHKYWRLVRSVRVGRKIRQETVAQLGELDAQGQLTARSLAEQLERAGDARALRSADRDRLGESGCELFEETIRAGCDRTPGGATPATQSTSGEVLRRACDRDR